MCFQSRRSQQSVCWYTKINPNESLEFLNEMQTNQSFEQKTIKPMTTAKKNYQRKPEVKATMIRLKIYQVNIGITSTCARIKQLLEEIKAFS